MPQPYLKPIIEIQLNRGVYGGPREDNWIGWAAEAPAVGLTDGDIFTVSITGAVKGVTKGGLSYSSTTWPYLTARSKVGTAPPGTNFDLFVNFFDGTTQTFTYTVPSPNYATTTFTLNSGKTVTNLRFRNQTQAGTILLDYVVGTKLLPIQLQEQGVGSVNRASVSVDDITFNLRNDKGLYTSGSQAISLFDDIYVYMGYLQDDTQTRKLSKVFGGTIEDITPILNTGGDRLQVHCYGWARALNDSLVATDFGSLSDNSGITTFDAAITSIINSWVNPNGYQLTTAYIQSFAPSLTYILFRNDPAFQAIKQLCDLLTAGDPSVSTVNPVEFWVDPAENCHLAPLGAWGSDPNPSTYPNALNVGRDQIENNFRQDIEAQVNKVHFIGGFVKPPNTDAFTEGTASSWSLTANGGGSGCASDDSSTGNFKKGGKSIKGSFSGGSSDLVFLNYNSVGNLGWQVDHWGGKISPPSIDFYFKSDHNPYNIRVQFVTSGGTVSTTNRVMIKDANWHIMSSEGGPLYFGPYGDTPSTGANWSTVNQIGFIFDYAPTAIASGNVWVDGLIIEGQTHYVATDSTHQAKYGTRETQFASHRVRELASLQALAKAELFRLHGTRLKGSIRVPGVADILPGQLAIVTAPSANYTSAIFRVLQVKHSFGMDGFITELMLTDDLTNYQALQVTSMSDMLLQLPHTAPVNRRQEQDTLGGGVMRGTPDPTNFTTVKDYPS